MGKKIQPVYRSLKRNGEKNIKEIYTPYSLTQISIWRTRGSADQREGKKHLYDTACIKRKRVLADVIFDDEWPVKRETL